MLKKKNTFKNSIFALSDLNSALRRSLIYSDFEVIYFNNNAKICLKINQMESRLFSSAVKV